MGGDSTGFLDEYGTIRFYSSGNSTFTLEILEDTVLNQSNYKKIGFGYDEEYFLYSQEYIYKRQIFDNVIINIPFISRILIDGSFVTESVTTDRYSYIFNMNTDSLFAIEYNNIEYSDVYAIRTEVIINTTDRDTVVSRQLLLSGRDGIIGIYTEDKLFLLDSIIH